MSSLSLEGFPITVNALIGLVTFSVFYKILAGKLHTNRFICFSVLCIGLSGLFDSISTHEYTTHENGAIIITGASSGIGRAAAIALANQGYNVYAGVRKEEDAASIRSERNAKLEPIILDVVNMGQIQAAVKKLEQTKLPLVALINNAGIASNLAVEVNPISSWRRVFDVNVFGVVECTQKFLPLLRKSKGRIVNIGSIAGDIGSLPGWAPYTPSKHAVEAISDATRVEMLEHGVSVSLIKPGAIKTDIWGKMHRSKAEKPNFTDLAKEMLDKHGRGSPETKELYLKLTEATMECGWDVDNNPSTPGTDLTDAAILHAVTSRFPKTRYLVAPDANVFYFLDHFLPDRVMDRLLFWFNYQGGYKMSHSA